MSLCFVSMKEILERHNLHSKNLSKLEQPSLELQVSFFSFLFFIFLKIWVTFSWHEEYDFDYYFWILLDLPFFICDEKEYVFFFPFNLEMNMHAAGRKQQLLFIKQRSGRKKPQAQVFILLYLIYYFEKTWTLLNL